MRLALSVPRHAMAPPARPAGAWADTGPGAPSAAAAAATRAAALAAALSTAVATALLAGLCGGAAAAAPATSAATGTRAQLRQCLVAQDQLDARRAQIEHATAEHAQAMVRLEAENARIADRQAELDHGSEKAVHEFNLLVADHNARARQLDGETTDFRVVTEAYNADALAHNRRCGGQLYRAEDQAAVDKERRAAGR